LLAVSTDLPIVQIKKEDEKEEEEEEDQEGSCWLQSFTFLNCRRRVTETLFLVQFVATPIRFK
jgi:hypothetical protein